MEAPQAVDPEATATRDFLFGEDLAPGERQVVSHEELLVRLTALVRSWEGCERVTVLEVYRLDRPDRRDGRNWSTALLLDAAGVAPEVYVLGYAFAVAAARTAWNLEEHWAPAFAGATSSSDLP
jgi:hypothetical protein